MQHSQTRLLHFSWRVVIAFLMVASLGIGIPGRVATLAAAQSTATNTAADGQYTIPTGNVNVVWPVGWTVYAQTEESLTLTNPAQTMLLQIMAIQVAGRTWDQIAANEVSFQMSGQGANGTVSGPVVTDSGFLFTADGEQGPFMEQGLVAADPAMFIRINTGNIAPGSDLTALATEAHGVTVDGVPALEGIEAVISPATAAAAPSATAAAAPSATDTAAPPATDTAAGGQFTISNGNVNVVWPAGWNVVSQSNNDIQLTNASETMHLVISGVPFNGGTWEEAEAFYQEWYLNDQGDSATISGPVVTENGFMFTTDGQNGPRMVNAFASSDPLVYVGVGAFNIAPGSDLTALVTEANGVTVDGKPALEGIEAVIPPAA